MPGMMLLIIIYAAAAVFLAVFTYRTVRIARMPIHLRWELAPIPHEKNKNAHGGSYLEDFEWWTKPREKSEISGIIYMAKEIVLLRGVWEHNRALWPYSFSFHAGIYLLVLAVFLIVSASLMMIASLNSSITSFMISAASVSAAAGYALGCAGSAGLLVKRSIDPDLRPFNTVSTYLNLLVLLALFASGGYACIATRDPAMEMSLLAVSVLSANPPAAVKLPLALHVLSACVFIAYLPFTHMIHFMAKYFTYHEVRWNDRPMDARSEREVKALLGQELGWSAPHVNGKGKTWVDVVKEGKNNE